MADNTDWKMTAEAAEETIKRVWRALGISTYEQAAGKAIDELVAEAVEKAWRYDQLNK